MSQKLRNLLKYMVPALLIVLITFELVQVALTSLYDEKQHKLSMMGTVLEHQIQQAHLSFDPANTSREQLGQSLQQLVDSLFVPGSDVDSSIYLPQQEQLVAFAPRSELHKSRTDHFPLTPAMRHVLASGQPLFQSTECDWRAEKVYSYLAPLTVNGKTVALICISQPLSTFTEQLQSIYISGITIGLLALLFLTMAGYGEYRRSVRLKLERDRLVQWLKTYNESDEAPLPLDSKLTLLKELPTEFKNAIQLVQFERKQKQYVLNELTLGVVTLDINGKIIYCNPHFGRLIGFAPEVVMTWDLTQWRSIYRLYGGGYLKDLHEKSNVENHRGLLLHRDGSEIPTAITVRSLFDDDNQLIGYLLIFNNLSSEFELNRLEQKTHHMFNSIPLCVILLDSGQQIEYTNPAVSHLFGCSEPELVGRPLTDALPSLFQQQALDLQKQLDCVLTIGLRSRLPQVRCLVQGQEYDLELELFPITNPFDGQTDGCMVLIKDMTLAREWEELSQRVDAHSSYVQMAATIAHEVRNPMTSVRGFLQLLGTNISVEQQRMYIDVMQMEVDRMNAILSEYLSMARAPQPEWELIHLSDLIRETLLVLEGEANYRGVTLLHDLQEDCLTQGIARELKQVVINLVRNAFDAMQQTQGRLQIELACANAHFQIRVVDNGCGISEEQVARIFDPFFTTKTMGTGLGLSVCKKIIESHGGTLSVQSRLGEGTSFVIELPEKSSL